MDRQNRYRCEHQGDRVVGGLGTAALTVADTAQAMDAIFSKTSKRHATPIGSGKIFGPP
jgi:hypothetical protein